MAIQLEQPPKQNASDVQREQWLHKAWLYVTTSLVPAGSVSAFAGSTAPDGWLLCDGTAVSRSAYAKLFNVIGETHGQGDNSTTFNVPDYRGRFLRMVDGDAGIDTDKASRSAMATGGNTQNNVGSVQADAFQGHIHQISSSLGLTGGIGSGVTFNFSTPINTGVPLSDGSHGTPRTSSETRPSNAYVNFIIKT